MIQTVEASINKQGVISLLSPVRISKERRAIVTILDEKPVVSKLNPAKKARQGWEEASKKLMEKGDPLPFEEWPLTQWDEEEWEW